MLGAYGLRDVCLSVPTEVGCGGVRQQIELALTPKERLGLIQSGRVLREIIQQVETRLGKTPRLRRSLQVPAARFLGQRGRKAYCRAKPSRPSIVSCPFRGWPGKGRNLHRQRPRPKDVLDLQRITRANVPVSCEAAFIPKIVSSTMAIAEMIIRINARCLASGFLLTVRPTMPKINGRKKQPLQHRAKKPRSTRLVSNRLLFEPCAGSTKPSPQPARLPCQDPGFDRSMPRAKDPLDLQRIPALPACVAMLMT